MQYKEFNNIINNQLDFCKELLMKKEEEYAEGSSANDAIDRLHHFKTVAAVMNSSNEQAVLSMLMKHIISIADMVNSKHSYSTERWVEKISDSINYLLILRAVIEENKNKEN